MKRILFAFVCAGVFLLVSVQDALARRRIFPRLRSDTSIGEVSPIGEWEWWHYALLALPLLLFIAFLVAVVIFLIWIIRLMLRNRKNKQGRK